EDVIGTAGDPRGDVIVDEIGHTVEGYQPVTGCKIDARIPLLCRHSFAHGTVAEGKHAGHRRSSGKLLLHPNLGQEHLSVKQPLAWRHCVPDGNCNAIPPIATCLGWLRPTMMGRRHAGRRSAVLWLARSLTGAHLYL